MSSLGSPPLPGYLPRHRLPQLASVHLPRPHLLQRLLYKPFKLRLLCAPIGFGKTTLLKECLHELARSQRCLWISLNGDALSLEQFRARMASALACSADDPGIFDTLESSDAPICLVLDDLVLDNEGQLQGWIERVLLEHDNGVQLLVSTRQRPDWNLPRLLLEGQLCELGADQLAFNATEYAHLAELQAPRMDACSQATLWQQTLGWCAGITLHLNARFTANRYDWHTEYLRHELLDRLSREQQELVIATSWLPKVNATLCDHLWPEQQGTGHFPGLLRQSLFQFIEPFEGWYRLLPPIAEILRHLLDAQELHHLRLRACRAYVAMDCLQEAIEQALYVGQPETAVSLLERLEFDWLIAGCHLSTMMHWSEHLPESMLDNSPRLICLQARALIISWRPDDALQCLEKLSRFLPNPDTTLHRRLLANGQALRGAAFGLAGHLTEAVLHCQAALADLDHRDWRSRYLCHTTLARLAIVEGEHELVDNHLDSALSLARRCGCLASEILSNVDAIRIALLRGKTEEARVMLQACRLLLQNSPQAHDSLLSGRLAIVEGELAFSDGKLDSAQAHFEQGVRHTLAFGDPAILQATLALARVAAGNNAFGDAQRFINDAERHMQCSKVQASCYQLIIEIQRARLLACHGDWRSLLTMAQVIESRLQAGHEMQPAFFAIAITQENQLLLALAEHGSGQYENAMQRLLRLVEQCQQLKLNTLLDEVLVALAIMQDASDRPPQLKRLCVGSIVYKWLARLRNGRTFDGAAPMEADTALTPKESAILRLLAAGLSNQQIGDRLFISVNTVKTHTRHINEKLGVKSRTQAIAHARSTGMFD